jgi:U3 small nucleolar RNA-associated protein 11
LKKAKLQRLREKARDRNPDEFAFGMLSARSSKQGRHGARDTAPLSQEAVKLLKTQDAGYLRTVGERVRREMERLEKDVQLQESVEKVLGGGKRRPSNDDDDDDEMDEVDEEGKPRKVIFADTREEQRKLGLLDEEEDEDNDSEYEDDETDEEDSFEQQQKKQNTQQQQQQPQQQPPKSKKQLEAERQAFRELRAANRLKHRAAEVRRNRLNALKKQHAEITAAERELDWQRGKMEHSVGGVNKDGLKWKIRERKR